MRKYLNLVLEKNSLTIWKTAFTARPKPSVYVLRGHLWAGTPVAYVIIEKALQLTPIQLSNPSNLRKRKLKPFRTHY